MQPAPAADPVAAAWAVAWTAAVRGPDTVPVMDQALLKIPEGFAFIPIQQAAGLMQVMGNPTGDTFAGLVLSLRQDAGWFVTLDYFPSGYIRDDDARDWSADELLRRLRAAAVDAQPPIEIVGWIDAPLYQEDPRHLAWAVDWRDPGSPRAPRDVTVNYNTRALGREGFVALDLVTNAARIESLEPVARGLLAGISFNDGKRYADFNPDTDRVAGYGLAALVVGVAEAQPDRFAGLAARLGRVWTIAAGVLIALVAGLGVFLVRWRRSLRA